MSRLLRHVARTPAAVPLLYAGFSGSLSGRDRAGAVAFTGTGAVRYLPAQNARTNLVKNPRFAVDPAATWVGSGSGGTGTWITGDGPPGQPNCYEVAAAVADSGMRCTTAYVGRVAGRIAHRVAFWAKSAAGGSDWRVAVFEFDAGGALLATVANALSFTAPTQWGAFALTYAPTQPAVHHICFGLRRGSATAGTVRVGAFVLESSPGGDSYFDGTTPGAAWLDPATGQLGTAHASPSVSAAAVLVEEATTNQVTDPIMGNAGTTQWAVSGGATPVLTKDTTYAFLGTQALKVVTDGSLGQLGARSVNNTTFAAPGQAWTASAWVRAPAGTPQLALVLQERTSAGGFLATVGSATVTPTDAWQRVVFSGTTANAGCQAVTLAVVANPATAATFWVGAAQLEQKAYATTDCAGSLGTGYTWSGTAHASSSSRAATTVKIGPESAYVIPGRCAVVAWFRRDADSGNFPTVYTAGALAAGADRATTNVRNSDDTLQAQYDVANVQRAAPMAPNTAVLGPWVCAYAGWDGAQIAGAADGRAIGVTDRATPTGNLDTANDVQVGSAAVSNWLDGPVGPVLILDRPLTLRERQKLVGLGPAWAFDALPGAVLPI